MIPCPVRTIKLVRGKRGPNNPPKAVLCDRTLGHPPPCKNGDWTLPQAFLDRSAEEARSKP